MTEYRWHRPFGARFLLRYPGFVELWEKKVPVEFLAPFQRLEWRLLGGPRGPRVPVPRHTAWFVMCPCGEQPMIDPEQLVECQGEGCHRVYFATEQDVRVRRWTVEELEAGARQEQAA